MPRDIYAHGIASVRENLAPLGLYAVKIRNANLQDGPGSFLLL